MENSVTIDNYTEIAYVFHTIIQLLTGDVWNGVVKSWYNHDIIYIGVLASSRCMKRIHLMYTILVTNRRHFAI